MATGPVGRLRAMMAPYLHLFRRDFRGSTSRLMAIARREGLRGLTRRLLHHDPVRSRTAAELYEAWIQAFEVESPLDDKRVAEVIRAVEGLPPLAILMPVYNPPEQFLRRALDTVLAQSYPHWELCIADDASPDPMVRRVLTEYAQKDSRIKVCHRPENGHISAASNSALDLVTADHVALMDHDDELHPHALFYVAMELFRHPDADLIYSDEDKIDESGRRSDPYFKPDWNYDLFLSHNMISHLGVYRTALVRSVGGFRSAFDGSQDYDLALRVIEQARPETIRHIPRVLYHWRSIEGSCAREPDAKTYPHERARTAIAEHLARIGRPDAVVRAGVNPFVHRVDYPVPDPAPTVTLIIPTKDRADLLEQCVRSVLDITDYPGPIDVMIVNNRSEKPETARLFTDLARDPRVRVLDWDFPYNYAALNNWAATQTDAPLLAFLNNDTEVITPDWLTVMAGHALRPEIGAVGARLFFPDRTVQHAGIVVGLNGVASNVHVGIGREDPGYAGRAVLTQSFSAVTAACLVVTGDKFEAVDGFDAAAFGIAFNDVDLCLRLGARGWRSLYTPHAELVHHESATLGLPVSKERRNRFQREIRGFRLRWADRVHHDPAYSPHLTRDGFGFRLAGAHRRGDPAHCDHALSARIGACRDDV